MSQQPGATRERATRRPLPHLSGGGRVWLFSGVIAALAATLYLTLVANLPAVEPAFRIPWWMLAVTFFVAEVLIVYVQFRRNAYSFSLSEIALVIGLFTVDPRMLVVAQLAGSAAALVIHRRQSLLKVAFNLSHFALETTVGLLVFHAFGSPQPLDPAAWGGALGATFVMALVADITIGVAVSLSEGKMQLQSIFQGLAFGKIVSATNTSIGLIGVMILAEKPSAVWLLAVPAAILFFAYRVYTSQREQHERMEFLYESTHLLNRSLKLEAALLTVLSQGRKMFRAEVSEIVLLPTIEGEPALRTTLGPGDRRDMMQPITLDPTVGVWARVAAESQPILLGRPITNERLRTHFDEQGIRDAIIAPLRGADGVVGIFMVANRMGDVTTFDDDDLRLFEALANHASVALENARLVGRLEESLEHLTEMNRMKDDFVATVSHELRTPLTSIQGSVKTLLQPGVSFDEETERSLLEVVDRQGERLKQLIEDLLVAARIESEAIRPVVAPVSLDTIARQVIESLSTRAHTHTIELDLGRDPGPIPTDERRVYQIISNLIDNALKYSPPGSTVTVHVRAATGGAEVAIEDQGSGISEEQREKIFERFYQADQTSTRQVGGTGLGLYICRRLAEVIGGRVGLERSNEDGSVFTLWIPARPPHDAMPAAEERIAQMLDLRGSRPTLVEPI